MILNLIHSTFDKDVFDKVVNALNELENNDTITMYLSSQGGRVSICEALLDIVNSNPEKFKVIGVENLESAAFIFFMNANCEKKILNNTLGMLHQTKTNIDVNEYNKPYYTQDEAELKRMKSEKAQSEDFIKKLNLTSKELSLYKKGECVYFQYDRFLEIIENYSRN